MLSLNSFFLSVQLQSVYLRIYSTCTFILMSFTHLFFFFKQVNKTKADYGFAGRLVSRIWSESGLRTDANTVEYHFPKTRSGIITFVLDGMLRNEGHTPFGSSSGGWANQQRSWADGRLMRPMRCRRWKCLSLVGGPCCLRNGVLCAVLASKPRRASVRFRH